MFTQNLSGIVNLRSLICRAGVSKAESLSMTHQNRPWFFIWRSFFSMTEEIKLPAVDSSIIPAGHGDAKFE